MTCKGCHSYEFHELDCELLDVSEHCPCSICLIKGMCYTACDEYQTYYEVSLNKDMYYEAE